VSAGEGCSEADLAIARLTSTMRELGRALGLTSPRSDCCSALCGAGGDLSPAEERDDDLSIRVGRVGNFTFALPLSMLEADSVRVNGLEAGVVGGPIAPALIPGEPA
jgi:hypothetical protein